MPYFMRQEALDRSLRAYGESYPDLEVELSICDDGSIPGVSMENARHPFIVTRLPEKSHALNPCVPINRAVNASTGDIVVITNPEIEHRKPVLRQMLDSLETEDHYVIAACWNSAKRSGYWIAHSTAQQYTGGRLPMPHGAGFHFCTMLHRSLWEKASGFDEEYREGQGCDDNDWLWRLENVGAKFVMRDDLVVYHYPTQTPWPSGGLVRNRRMLKAKWGHKWNRS